MEFEREVAPRIVEAVEHTFNISGINMIKEQVEKMKNHLDSSIFQAI
jgi:hypothetical protein